MSGLTARVSAMQRPGVPANRGSRVVAAARPAVVRPRSIVPGMTSSRVAMAVRADASKPAGSNGAKLATVAQPTVEAESVPGKSKFVVPALAFAAAAAALTPAAPASAAAAAVVATVNQADTAWILISTGESARASDACPLRNNQSNPRHVAQQRERWNPHKKTDALSRPFPSQLSSCS